MKVAAANETTYAAQSQAVLDNMRDICDPHGSFQSWRTMNNLWNSDSPETSRQAEQEVPLAYKLYVRSYLQQQGWFGR